jgi:hypothetical protein
VNERSWLGRLILALLVIVAAVAGVAAASSGVSSEGYRLGAGVTFILGVFSPVAHHFDTICSSLLESVQA